MGKKTVIRRLFKYLPVSIEMTQAVTLDEAADRGAQEHGVLVPYEVNRETGEIIEKEERILVPREETRRSRAERIAEKLAH